MSRQFKNPINDKVEKIDIDTSVCVFFFGPLYLAYKGLWKHTLIWLLIAAPLSLVFGDVVLFFSIPFACIIYAVSIQPIMIQKRLNQCWEDVTRKMSTPYEILQAKLYVESINSTFMDANTEQSIPTKPCQFCSAIVSIEARSCSHCHSDLSADMVRSLSAV